MHELKIVTNVNEKLFFTYLKFLNSFELVFFYFLLFFLKKNIKVDTFMTILLLYYVLNECKNVS